MFDSMIDDAAMLQHTYAGATGLGQGDAAMLQHTYADECGGVS